MSEPLKVFITYSHNDRKQNTTLKTRLAVMESEDKIKLWDDNEILPGDEWYKDISINLDSSDILLYLVSAASLASKNCNKELAGALEINIRVIPIILESCDWENHQLSRFEVLPHKGKPISKWDHESDGWQNVVDGIRKAVDKMQSQAKSPSGPSEKELLTELVFQQGNILMMLGQIEIAIEAYSYAITLNWNNAAAYNNRGVAYGDKGDYDRAIADFTQAIDLNPDYADAYNNRGNAYGNKGDYDRAIADFTQAIDLNPDYADAYNNRGGAYYLKEEYESAITDFTKAIELNPDYAIAYNNRGVAHHLREEYKSAITDFTKAIQLKPDYAIAYNNRGRAYSEKGEVDSLTICPDSPSAKLAVIQAIKDYNPAIGLNPELAPAYYNRGVAWLRLREWERAKSDLTVARDMGLDIITAFDDDYESVEGFEGRNGVQLPKDIAAMLL